MSLQDKVHCSLMCAIICILGLFPPITLSPLPVPITIQSLGVMLAGSLLGSKKALLTLSLFLLMVAIGVPALPGMKGGISVFFLPTVGFLLAWPISAYVIGWCFEKYNKEDSYILAFLYNFFGGIIIMYAIAIPIVSLVAKMSLFHTMVGMLVYVPGDMLKAILTAIIVIRLKKYVPHYLVNAKV